MEDLSALEEIRVSGSSAPASAVGEWLLPGSEQWLCTRWRWGGGGGDAAPTGPAPGVRRESCTHNRGGAAPWGSGLGTETAFAHR